MKYRGMTLQWNHHASHFNFRLAISKPIMAQSGGNRGGCKFSPSAGRGSATVPQALQVLALRSFSNAMTPSLTCVPRSVQWKLASWTILLQFLQYHLNVSRDFSGLGCSRTIPTVSAKRTGLWGVFAGSKKSEFSWIGMSTKEWGVVDASTVLRSIDPRC